MGANYRRSRSFALARKRPLLTLLFLLLAAPCAALAGSATTAHELAPAAIRSAAGGRIHQIGATQQSDQPKLVAHSLSEDPRLTAINPIRQRIGLRGLSTPKPQLTTVPIFYDGFELDPWPYPTDPWKIYDLSDDGKDRVWNDVSYRSYTGSWSAWPAGGGFDGKAPSPDDENYFNNLNTWMIYGPFDLSDAQDAAMAFYLWRDIKANDTLFYGASLNGLDFYGDFVDGTVDWTDTFFDLSSYAGHNAVWVGWQFKSDASGTAAGPYIDDILIAKFVADAPNVFRLFLPTTIKQEGGAPGPELCDQYEPNDRLSTAFGPLVSGEVYTARMCADDKEDLYYFQAAQPGQVQITLNLAQSLYPEASLYLYAPDGRTLISGCYNAPPQSGRTGTSKPIIVSCAVTAGKQTLRITTKGTTNPANQYTVKVVFPQ